MKTTLTVRSDGVVAAMSLLLPLLAAALAATVLILAIQGTAGLLMICLIWAALVLTYVVARSSYVGTYTFISADAYHGAHIVIEQGSRRYEVKGIPASGYVYGQSWLEKRRGVGHITVKGTLYKMRGIPQGEQLMAWIQANFPDKQPEKKRRRR